MHLPGATRLGALALALFVSSPAGAVVAQVWTETSLRFSNLGNAKGSATATGVATLQTSSSSAVHLSTLTLPGQSLVTTMLVTDPTQAPITRALFDVRQRPDLQGGGVIGNISGAIGGEPGGSALTPRTIPMTGAMTICFLVHVGTCLAKLPVPVGATSSGAQVGLGVGGLLTVGGGTASIRVSLVGAPYTVRTVSAFARTENGGLDAATARGFAHGPASATSSTAQTSGVLQIVTASHITVVGPGDHDVSGALSHTLVHIVAVPEPGLLLLFLSGAGFVALLGARRRRGG